MNKSKLFLTLLACAVITGLGAGERMIYIARHCQAAGKAQSALKPVKGDAGITELGIRQSKLLGGALKKLKFSGPIFASPYYRTVATASFAAGECGAKVYPDARVQERAYGHEGGNIRTGGAKLEELRKLFPDAIAPDAKLDPEWLLKVKENHRDQTKRMTKALDELLAENPDRDFMIVTHAGAVGALVRILSKRSGIEFDKDNFIWNCCLFKFAVDDAGKYRFVGYDISFMPEDAVTSNLKDSLLNHKAGGKRSKSGTDYKL